MSKVARKSKVGIKGKDVDEEDFGKDIDPGIREYMIREAFNMFDEDHSGEIDKSEFRTLIGSLGLKLTDKQIDEMMKSMDKDGSGSIDYEEFSAAMRTFQFGKESSIKQHIESAFNDYDKDMDAYISAQDFLKLSSELDKSGISKEDAALFVSMCKHFGAQKNIPSTSDTLVSKEEFINFLCSIQFLVDVDDNVKGNQDNLDKSQGISMLNMQSEAKNISSIRRYESRGSKGDSSFFNRLEE